MIRWPLTVTYRDGAAVSVVADQYALGVYLRWAHKSGLPVIDFSSTRNPVELIVPIRVFAWAELQRDAQVKQSFDVWDATVSNVEMESPGETVDPTLMATSVG